MRTVNSVLVRSVSTQIRLARPREVVPSSVLEIQEAESSRRRESWSDSSHLGHRMSEGRRVSEPFGVSSVYQQSATTAHRRKKLSNSSSETSETVSRSGGSVVATMSATERFRQQRIASRKAGESGVTNPSTLRLPIDEPTLRPALIDKESESPKLKHTKADDIQLVREPTSVLLYSQAVLSGAAVSGAAAFLFGCYCFLSS